MSAPSTVGGKVLLVFYGLLGCSATILFFNLLLERVIRLVTHIILQCHRSRTTHRDQEKKGGHDDRKKKLKPSVYQVLIILKVVVVLIACAAASLYWVIEGWTYLESLCFCFLAFSTIGFGDLVSSQRAQHGETLTLRLPGYKLSPDAPGSVLHILPLQLYFCDQKSRSELAAGDVGVCSSSRCCMTACASAGYSCDHLLTSVSLRQTCVTVMTISLNVSK